MIAVKQVEIPTTASDKSDSRQASFVQALKLESETLKDLDHPHIVAYLGFEETPSFLSMYVTSFMLFKTINHVAVFWSMFLAAPLGVACETMASLMKKSQNPLRPKFSMAWPIYTPSTSSTGY